MDYSLENRPINLDKATIIGYGKNGNVYKYKNLALKIFPNGVVPEGLMDSNTCYGLSKIPTIVILLPSNKIFYKKKLFSGYSFEPISGIRNRNIVKMDKKLFIGNIQVLEDDVSLLSKKGVLLDGILPENVVVADKFYLIDPAKYSFVDKSFSSGLYDLNSYQIHLLLSKLVLTSLKKTDVAPNKIRKFKTILLSKENNQLSSKFFDELIGEEKNIYSYVKKMR